MIKSKAGLMHKKGWKWALGIIAMCRVGKLNKRCTAIGVGAGKRSSVLLITLLKSSVFSV
jgi:hypothetical protein